MISEIECVPSRDQKEATRNAHSKFTANDEFGFQFKANRICNAHDLLANSIILNDKCHHHNRITGSRWNHTVFTRTNQRFFLTVQLCKRKLAASEKKKLRRNVYMGNCTWYTYTTYLFALAAKLLERIYLNITFKR